MLFRFFGVDGDSTFGLGAFDVFACAGGHARPCSTKKRYSTGNHQALHHKRKKEWKQAWEQYTFQQSIEVQEVAGTDVRAEYRQVADYQL